MRKAAYALLFIIVLFIGWYFIIKDHDYRISFKTQSSPAIVYTTLDYWNHYNRLEEKNIKLGSNEPFNSYAYSLITSDDSISFNWEFKRLSDSLTEVKVYTKDLKNSLKQKIEVPIIKNSFVEKSTVEVKNFIGYLNGFKNAYNVEILRPAKQKFKEQHYAYVSSKGEIKNKANLMLQSIGDIMAYIKDNNIELNGDPFLKVTHWNQRTGEIEFDFCFPIRKSPEKPSTNIIKFGYLNTFQALRADFNGNYRESNFAWNALLEYAQEHNISVQPLPIEIYRNDPHNGGNPLEWKAEVYFPLNN
ncbi:hypothetical protein [Aegicerativicinus sediminis]|uniref:hypothetical protein n=1 Tax=Aegicerativicinus sediminis TaxID=2893202 RepID=UPI001E460080|nr:hypothetical protein [Aegicerativicinus sediminis]